MAKILIVPILALSLIAILFSIQYASASPILELIGADPNFFPDCKSLDPAATVSPSTNTCDVHTITLNDGQTLQIGNGVTLIVENSFTNYGIVHIAGTLDLNAGGSIINNGNINIIKDGSLTINGGSINLGGTSLFTINDGNFNLNGGTMVMSGNSKETIRGDSAITLSGNTMETINGDNTITISGNTKETVNGNQNIIINGQRTETVSGHETVTVHGDRTETVNGKETITIHGSRTETVDGNEKITIAGQRTETVDHDETITIHGSRTETVDGNEKITVHHDRTETVDHDETITIHGSRTETVGHDETITIHHDSIEAVHGSELITIHGSSMITVEHDESHWVGHDRTKTIDHDETTRVHHDRTETVDGNEMITIHGSRTGTVDHDETITIHGSKTENVGKNENITVGNQRTETVSSGGVLTIGGHGKVTVSSGSTITIAKGGTFTVDKGTTFSNGGIIDIGGLMSNNGKVENFNSIVAVCGGIFSGNPPTGNKIMIQCLGPPQATISVMPTPAVVNTVETLSETITDPSCQACTTFSYAWTLSGPPGSSTVISDPTAQNPTFTPDLPGNYQTGLVVTDALGFSSAQTFLKIAVSDCGTCIPNVSPTATPNPSFTGDKVSLDANPSDVGCSTCVSSFTYKWQIISTPSGSSATLSNQNIQNPIIAPDVAGSWQFSVIATDSTGQSSNPGLVTLVVQTTNTSPQVTLSSLPTSPVVGDKVTLSANIIDPGCASCIAPSSYSYSWSMISKPSGSAAALSSTSDPSPTFTPDLPGNNYQLSLVVTDTLGHSSSPAFETITVSNCGSCKPVVSPTIMPNPDTVAVMTTLDANPSDAGCAACVSSFTYKWQITSAPPGSSATLSDPTVQNPTFTPVIFGNYQFSVIAMDSTGQSSTPGFVTLTAIPSPVTPTITAPNLLTSGKSYAASLSARSGMTYLWTVTDGTITSPGGNAGTLSLDGTTNSISFTAGLPGPLTISAVEINAASDTSAPGSATATVFPAPIAPTITVSNPVISGQSYSASVTARTGMTYLWAIADGTITSAGGNAGVTANGINSISFTAGTPGSLILSVTETNAAGDSASSISSLVVNLIGAPAGISTDIQGNVYVVDSVNKKVEKFDSSGNLLFQFGSTGSGPGQFNDPQGIALDGSGQIYVTDKTNNRVERFDSSGNFQSQFGTSGSGPGQFNGAEGIAVGNTGFIYVTDSNNNRVEVFDSSGNLRFQFGTLGSNPGQFNNPQGIAIDSLGNIYVTDSGNNRVERFGSSANFQFQFGSTGNGIGQFNNPQGIAVDNTGHIYVTDSNNNRVEVFDSSDTFRFQFGSTGSNPGQFNNPQGIAVDSLGHIYVTDSNNNRIERFDSSGNLQFIF